MDPSVVGLVYSPAHMPDFGEKESDNGKRFPSELAKSGAIKKTPDGFTYIDPAQFHELFAADLPADQAALMARSQVLNFADNFSATITTAAWRTKPSWMLVAGSDRTINPELERYRGCIIVTIGLPDPDQLFIHPYICTPDVPRSSP